MNRLPALLGIAIALAAAQPSGAADPKVTLISFPKDRDVNAALTLMKADGKTGRQTPVFNGYRPQLRFAGSRAEVTCGIRFPPPADKIEPGETAPVIVRCADAFEVDEDKLSFSVFEGGRKVGDGVLEP